MQSVLEYLIERQKLLDRFARKICSRVDFYDELINTEHFVNPNPSLTIRSNDYIISLNKHRQGYFVMLVARLNTKVEMNPLPLRWSMPFTPEFFNFSHHSPFIHKLEIISGFNLVVQTHTVLVHPDDVAAIREFTAVGNSFFQT